MEKYTEQSSFNSRVNHYNTAYNVRIQQASAAASPSEKPLIKTAKEPAPARIMPSETAPVPATRIYLNPKGLCFKNSALNQLFPLPFIAAIDKIHFVIQRDQHLFIKASLTQEIRDFLIRLKDSKVIPTLRKGNEYNMEKIEVEITKTEDGYGNYTFKHPKLPWIVFYHEKYAELHVNTFETSIISTEQTITSQIKKGELCPYCHADTQLVSDEAVYGRPFGKKFIQCKVNPDHYVGTYANGKSLGRLADKNLRLKKREAHAVFDPMWSDTPKLFKKRNDAYQWLSKKMRIPSEETHFGMFDEAQCAAAIEHVNRYVNKRKEWQKIYSFFKLK
jgi:hypothetical protein